MNEPFDPLEAELESLRPRPLAPDLRQRIADKLDSGALTVAHSGSRRIWWSGAAIGGLIAASLAATLLLRPGPAGKSEFKSFDAPLELSVAAAFDDALPTVWTYRRALNRPPQELEALLDEHAALSTPSRSQTPTQLFIRFDTELFNGEL